MNTPNKDAKKKNPFPGIVLAIVLFSAVTAAENFGSDAGIFVLFAIIFCTVIVAAAIKAIKKTKKQHRPTENGMPSRSYTTHADVPDAHCVVCENTGEDHFSRDKARRLAQLDDFLKNGIIDKAEYKTLRNRFENDI